MLRLAFKHDLVDLRNGIAVDIAAHVQRLDTRIDVSNTALRSEMQEMERRLFREIGSAVNTIAEKFADYFGAFEEKYGDLPARVAALEARC